MIKTWRLILEDRGGGYHNMAVDEALLLHYSSLRLPTLRIYGWNKHFISLGCNQPAEVISRNHFPLVRRITGGAAIVHYDEVTYSLVCSRSDLKLPAKVKESYKVLCSFLIEFYARLGLEAKFAQDVFPQQEQTRLGRYGRWCFSSWELFDLMINGRKIGGNAQRRRKDIIFQHGSLPQSLARLRQKAPRFIAGMNGEASLAEVPTIVGTKAGLSGFGEVSPFSLFGKPRDLSRGGFTSPVIKQAIKTDNNFRGRATSLNEQLNSTTDYSYLASLLAEAFKETFNVKFVPQGLFKEEAETVNLLLNKYQSKEWNYRI